LFPFSSAEQPPPRPTRPGVLLVEAIFFKVSPSIHPEFGPPASCSPSFGGFGCLGGGVWGGAQTVHCRISASPVWRVCLRAAAPPLVMDTGAPGWPPLFRLLFQLTTASRILLPDFKGTPSPPLIYPSAVVDIGPSGSLSSSSSRRSPRESPFTCQLPS